ncbi:MAG: hypothetical protein CMO01_15255 [Thalassobius sp.]|nr:hypothetical protein [Thalassovita sp.]
MLDFQLDHFKGSINDLIGESIVFLKVVGNKTDGNLFTPTIFWLKTSKEKCRRFFIDAWVLHWTEFSLTEMNEQIVEDFAEDDLYKVCDISANYNLLNKRIERIYMDYICDDGLVAELEINIEGGIQIIVQDFGDEKEQKLIINESKC